MSREIRIGVSTCLLGERVRYDGGHKRDAFVNDVLGRFVKFVPVCPEMEIGLGTPREAIHLRREGKRLRLVGTKSDRDLTSTMSTYARRRVNELSRLDLCGYVLKAGSPSCGMERVPVHGGGSRATGSGLFAAELMSRLPLLPIEEEGRLRDPKIRENFIARVLAYRRLKDLFAPRWKLAALTSFHEREKAMLGPRDREALGRLVAKADELPRREISERYLAGFMAAIAK